jgi:hypothetical protein
MNEAETIADLARKAAGIATSVKLVVRAALAVGMERKSLRRRDLLPRHQGQH